VYLSYGIHWCLNFVCREEGHAAGVLIRALEPTVGIPTMRTRRQQTDLRLLCAGPGRLCQALAVTSGLNGKPIDRPPFQLLQSAKPVKIVRGTRIGVSKAAARVWRYGLKDSAYHSRPFQ
jgi:DNA-3-methyladenine glycosylase